MQFLGLTNGIADGLRGLERTGSDEDVQFNRYLILLQQTDGCVDLFAGDAFVHIRQDLVVERLNTQIDIPATGRTEHLGNRFGDGIHTCLTTPDDTRLPHHLADSGRTLLIPDKIIIHEADSLDAFLRQMTHLFRHLLR